jgi:hypothetical protein
MFISFLNTRYGDETQTPPVSTPAEKPPEVRTFTQDEVNAMLAENKRGLQKKLEELQKSSGDAKALQTKLKEVQDHLMTKEELAKREQEQLKATYEEQLKMTASEKAQWEDRYKAQLFNVELSKADRKHNLYDADQFGLILKPMTEIVAETDSEGKPTGGFKVMAKVDIDGKPLTLPLDEAIGKLRESGKYPNQFKVAGSSGTGVTLNNNPTPNVSGSLKPNDVEGFMKHYGKLKTEGKIR